MKTVNQHIESKRKGFSVAVKLYVINICRTNWQMIKDIRLLISINNNGLLSKVVKNIRNIL